MDKKRKVIIDTDPGVDDIACLIYALLDKNTEIKLITSVVGNVKIETSTRNILHVLNLFNSQIPVAKGAEAAMKRTSPTAEFIHKKEGMGGYIPPASTSQHLLLEDDAVEAMYKVLKEGHGDITLIALGPQTNVGTLLFKHPDIISKIPQIIFMGGSPIGMMGFPDYISFNISSDPEAFKIVLDSNIPLVMIPSAVGRTKAHLDENYVYNLKEKYDIGKMMFDMYSMYWEPGYPDKRIATNDSCAFIYHIHPEAFKTTKIDIDLDIDKEPGKIHAKENENGRITLIYDVDRPKFLNILDNLLEKGKDVKIY